MKKQYISDVTAAQVAAVLSYNPATGLFVYTRASFRRYVGMQAGRVDSKGYFRIRLFGHEFKSHRLAWLLSHGVWPDAEIDHINGIPGDNRLVNLRAVTTAENGQNRTRAMKNNTLGILGVCPVGGRYQAQIRACGKPHYLGLFDTPEAAQAAYLAAKQRLHIPCATTPPK